MHEVHRIDAIASAIYDHAFHLLDSEPDTDGMQCGRVATEVEEAFKRAMRAEQE